MNEVTTDTPKKSLNLRPIFIAIVLVVLAAGAYFFFIQKEGGAKSETVAVVNGTAIDGKALDRGIQQVNASYTSQGMDVGGAETEAAVREQALSALINRQLILDAAINAGVTTDDAAVETEYQNAVSNLGGEENLAAALLEVGMSDEDLRADIKKDLMISAYLEQTLDLQSVTVTDEEIQIAYKTADENNEEELPALEEVEEVIRNQLVYEKQQQLIGAELDRLRAEADIEIKT